MSDQAVVLISGGVDSVTTLALALDEGYGCHCLSFDYGQRHHTELQFAQRAAEKLGATEHKVVRIDLDAFGGSALTDSSIAIPTESTDGIPPTYVPARNTVFLAYALAWAEVLAAMDIFIGVNAVDYSGYPDCRPEFIDAFEKMANVATRFGVEGNTIKVRAPLIDLKKEDIIRRGIALGVNYADTLSCYQPVEEGLACGVCDSCRIRRAGFERARVPDPTRYQPN